MFFIFEFFYSYCFEARVQQTGGNIMKRRRTVSRFVCCIWNEWTFKL